MALASKHSISSDRGGKVWSISFLRLSYTGQLRHIVTETDELATVLYSVSWEENMQQIDKFRPREINK